LFPAWRGHGPPNIPPEKSEILPPKFKQFFVKFLTKTVRRPVVKGLRAEMYVLPRWCPVSPSRDHARRRNTSGCQRPEVSTGSSLFPAWRGHGPPNIPPEKVDFGNILPINTTTKFQLSHIMFTPFNIAIPPLTTARRRFLNFALVL